MRALRKRQLTGFNIATYAHGTIYSGGSNKPRTEVSILDKKNNVGSFGNNVKITTRTKTVSGFVTTLRMNTPGTAPYEESEPLSKSEFGVICDKAVRPEWVDLETTTGKEYWDSAEAGLYWYEMEDGAFVTCMHATESGYARIAMSNKGLRPQTVTFSDKKLAGTVTIDGKPYEVTFLDFGFVDEDGSSTVDTSEASRYVKGRSGYEGEYGGVATTWPKGPVFEPLQNWRLCSKPKSKAPLFSDVETWKYKTYGYDGEEKYLEIPSDAFKSYPNVYLVARPAKYKPWAQIRLDYGVRTKGFELADEVFYGSGDTVDYVVRCEGRTIAQAEGVPKSQGVRITDEQFSRIGAGKKTLEVVVSAGSESNEYSVSLEAASNAVEVAGNPHEVGMRPVGCTLANAVVVGEGGFNRWLVSNNAADEEPAWEAYEGDSHVFSNKSKTADKWAIGWKCEIGGPGSTSRSELIRQVAMGVIYE